MSKFSCFFGNPNNKTGTAYTWGTTNSKPPRPIIVINQSEILPCSQVQVIRVFLGGAQLCCAFYQPRQVVQLWWEKPISWAKAAHFDFFAINLTVWRHILSTVGDALSTQTISIGCIFCFTHRQQAYSPKHPLYHIYCSTKP
jgi:hypothetical protein